MWHGIIFINIQMEWKLLQHKKQMNFKTFWYRDKIW